MVDRPAPLIRWRITACSQRFAVPMWRDGCFLEPKVLGRLSHVQCCWEPKSNQPGLGHSTAEDAKVRRGKTILNNLCEPLRPLRLIRLIHSCTEIFRVFRIFQSFIISSSTQSHTQSSKRLFRLRDAYRFDHLAHRAVESDKGGARDD